MEYLGSGKFWETLTTILITFVLTTLVGTWLTFFLQKRSWEHQQQALNRKNLRDERRKIFEELTNVTGKRIYRMRRLQWALRSGNAKMAEGRLEDYAAVLIEWNDNISRIFSLVEIYFGKDLRDYFEKSVSLDLVHIGSLLEKRYKSGDFTSPTPHTTRAIDNMSGKLENLQRRMLKLIES